MNLKDIHTSKTVRGVIIGLGIAILILGIFKLGMVAGSHKARFSEHFGDNFNRNFVSPGDRGFMGDLKDMGPGDHGSVGEIISIASSTIIVADRENVEKTIVVNSETRIRQFRDEVAVTDLKVGDHIVVLGEPNEEGQIVAKLIRTVPPPPMGASSTPNTTAR